MLLRQARDISRLKETSIIKREDYVIVQVRNIETNLLNVHENKIETK